MLNEILINITNTINLVPLPFFPFRCLIAALAIFGLFSTLKLPAIVLFELTRAQRPYGMRFPMLGIRLSLRINHWEWQRRRDLSAPFFFENTRTGAILQISTFPCPVHALPKPISVRRACELLRDEQIQNSLEEDVPVRALNSLADAHYYQYIDKKVKPGEWAFITRAIIEQEDTRVRFSYLSHNIFAIDAPTIFKIMRSISVTRTAPPSPELMAKIATSSSAPSDEPEPPLLPLASSEALGATRRGRQQVSHWGLPRNQKAAGHLRPAAFEWSE